MERSRLQRSGLQWGGLALVAQLWTALYFVHCWETMWSATQPELASFAQSVDRFSQFKTPALKYPYAAIYFSLFVAALAGLLGWLMVRGLREAMAPEPESSGQDDER